MACGDVWQVRYAGAPSVCFKGGDHQHLATHCKAHRRKEEITRWEEGMGPYTELFFPTMWPRDMTEEEYTKKQKVNVE